MMPAYFELAEVFAFMPTRWSKQRKLRALERVGVVTRIGPRNPVVIVEELRSKLPQLFDRVLRQQALSDSVS